MRRVLVAIVTACLLVLCIATQAAHANSIRVCPPLGNQRNCQSYDTIQDAINMAAPNSVISLTNGIYTEAGLVIDRKDLTIRGQEPRNTIIQASPVACQPVDKDGKPIDEPPKRVLQASNAAIRIENLTIQNGCLENGSESLEGAGIWNSGMVSLYRVIMISNTINYSGTDQTPLGGGVYNIGSVDADSSSFLTNTVFTNGPSAMGGGIYSNGRLDVVNSTFSHNIVFGCYGGPSRRYEGAAFYVKDKLVSLYNTIVYNQAGDGGNAIISERASALTNNLLWKNSDPNVPSPDCPRFGAGSDASQVPAPAVASMESSLLAIRLSDLLTTTIVPVYRQLEGSSGIDTGVCLNDVSVDQVGDSRNNGNGCDLGATEMGITFMPSIIMAPLTPDLKVVGITVEPQGELNSVNPAVIKVVIENVGAAPARRDFWVDLYINPRSTPPNKAGTPWSSLCRSADCINDLGITWKISTRLLPGERLTLTSRRMEDPFIWLPESHWEGKFFAGPVEMWAYVDSWNGPDAWSGWVDETYEDNNRYGPLRFTVPQGTVQEPIGSAMFPSIVSDRPLNQE